MRKHLPQASRHRWLRSLLLALPLVSLPIDQSGRSLLRFEARWLKEKNFSKVVQEAWDQSVLSGHDASLADRLALIHRHLHAWDRSVLKQTKKKLRGTQKELEELSRKDLSDANIARQKELADEIEKLLEMEELYWAQRSRVNWLQFGDRNTAYFQNFASARRLRNRIKKLRNAQGDWQEGTAYLNPIISEYFAGLFTTEIDEPDPEFINRVVPRVTNNMNEELLKPYSAEDVKKALFSIGDTKAPGTDGLHAIFFKKCWHIVGDMLTSEVLNAINEKNIPAGWNDTAIVLIPKVDNLKNISQYRPISLCNVLYKIISKMIAFRLKSILDEIIAPVQSAFVPGRSITDNILIAYESMHTIKNKKKGKVGYCALKLDMHKAYDRVEWVFLEKIMSRLGFHEEFIELLMACVKSVKYRVRFNDRSS